MKINRRFLSTVFLVLVCGMYAGAKTTTWDGSIGDWSDELKWDNGLPQADDEVIVNAGTVTVSSATAELTSYTHNGGILIFTNWNTSLQATTVTINDGMLTHAVCDISTETDNTNRVWIVCSNLTVAVGGSVNVDASGYLGGLNGTTIGGQGPGGGGNGNQNGAAGSYGGIGGNSWYSGTAGSLYGVANLPIEPGSGGGASFNNRGGDGGNGGGAVRIEAEGTVTVNGTVSANGGFGNKNRGAGGSGGAIYITCRTMIGSGTVSANGGDAHEFNGGGGGRIAISVNADAQQSEGVPDILFTLFGGLSPNANGTSGDIGTVWITDASLLDVYGIRHTGQLVSPVFTTLWSTDEFVVSNGYIRLIGAGLEMLATSKLSVIDEGILELPSSGVTVHCGGDLVVTDSSSLHVYAAATNGLATEYGALVSVTGTVSVSGNSWILPYSHGTDGGSVLFQVGELNIETNAGFNAVNKGYASVGRKDGYGPGGGLRGVALSYGSGGGYGGAGGDGTNSVAPYYISGGSAYGSDIAPKAPGSAGGAQADNGDSSGGGLIWIEVDGDAILDGVLNADSADTRYGGGSGGGIFLRCVGSFSGGPNSVLSASGGSSTETLTTTACGGGGGGRIAVWFNTPRSAWSRLEQGTLGREVISTTHSAYKGEIDVTAGTGEFEDGEDGTIVFLETPLPKGTVILVL